MKTEKCTLCGFNPCGCNEEYEGELCDYPDITTEEEQAQFVKELEETFGEE